MTFLPIVERELRVAARKRSSFWLRVVAALVGVVIGAACLLLASVGPFWSNTPGTVLFGALTWISLGAALSAGLFFTSDCVSEEKREGTLGFLFLTDLHGYDVIGGKLLATSLRGFYALLAIFPILAATLLMGGITGVEFWKTSLALVNALVCSLAAGLFVSTMSRDSQKAMGATLLLLLLMTVGGPIGDSIRAATKGRGFVALWSLTSPGYVFKAAGAWGRTPYWLALGLTQTIAWSFLALACWLVPRTWQQRTNQPAPVAMNWTYAWKFGGNRRRMRIRGKLIDRNPVLWLACRERWQALGMWLLALLGAAGLAFITAGPSEAWLFWGYLWNLFTLVLYLWVASQAGRVFVDARRSGLTELLLSAPLVDGQIVRGQWAGLVRLFGAPLVLLLAINLIASGLSQLSMQGIISQAAPPVTVTTSTNSSSVIVSATATTTVMITPRARAKSRKAVRQFPPVTAAGVGIAALTAGASMLTTAANLVALCWFGMWMGVTSRTAHLATLKTILFVQVVPWFVISFASWMIIMSLTMSRFFITGSTQSAATWRMMNWWPALFTLLAALLAIGKDIGFILWSRKQLFSRFREYASRTPGQPKFIAPPPLPPIIGVVPETNQPAQPVETQPKAN